MLFQAVSCAFVVHFGGRGGLKNNRRHNPCHEKVYDEDKTKLVGIT